MNEELKSENNVVLSKDASNRVVEPSSHPVQLDEVEKMIAAANNEMLKKAQIEIDNAKDEVLKEARVEIDKQLQIDRASLITVFSIFASVLSFLTIEFSFFKKFDSLKSISGFSCILFSLLFGFNIGLDYLVKSNLRNNSYYRWYYVILLGIIFCTGIYLILQL
jgi:CRISPR/Cas system-associated protein Csx1